MVRRALGFSTWVMIAVFSLLGSGAWATHEVDHRFTIFGSVRDGSSFPGKPLAGRDIRFLNPKTGQAWEIVDAQGQLRPAVMTDDEGRYSAILHVHNEDLGSVVKILVEATEKQVVLTFDPQDKRTERRVQVDIVVFPK